MDAQDQQRQSFKIWWHCQVEWRTWSIPWTGKQAVSLGTTKNITKITVWPQRCSLKQSPTLYRASLQILQPHVVFFCSAFLALSLLVCVVLLESVWRGLRFKASTARLPLCLQDSQGLASLVRGSWWCSLATSAMSGECFFVE